MNQSSSEFRCPQCGAIHEGGWSACKQCGLPLAWIAHSARFHEALRRPLATALSPSSPPAIEVVLPGVIPLDVNSPVMLGRRIAQEPHFHEVPDARVELEHCVVVREPQADHYWLADLGTRHGTWINRGPVTTARLSGGDVLQLGGFAWVFSESDHALVPLPPMEGAELRLESVAVEAATRRGRKTLLAELSLFVPAGQLVAIAVESGAGKSTLMKAILGARLPALRGMIIAGGYQRDEQSEEYCALLGYVPQHEIVHPDLTAWEAIDLAARLRGRSAPRERIAQLLRRLDVPRERWEAPPRRLSGGELQRVRIATELIAGPRLLLLDEPASGLDQGREIRLMKLLRGLSIQGCTVLVITHGLRHLDYFDRVLILQRGGVLRFDGSPQELRSLLPRGEFTDLDLSDPPSMAKEPPGTPPRMKQEQGRKSLLRRMRERVNQLAVVFHREMRTLDNAKFRRLLVPLLVMPVFFATALHVAVPADNLPLLGFFVILACIWMGSSLSLMAIVNERSILDHERLLFLHVGPYVLAKCAVLGLISAIQTVLLVILLSVLRARSGGEMLLELPWPAAHLMLVGWAAVGVGLFISAASGENRALANFLLPLFMIVQILFSVHVAGDGELSLRKAYGEFHVYNCQGPHACPRRAEHWLPADGSWLCHKCFVAFRHCTREQGGLAAALPCMHDRLAPESPFEPAVVKYNRERPRRLAAGVSYLTLSRHGDIALRAFAYERGLREAADDGASPYDRYGYARWRCAATAVLATMIAGFPLATWWVLRRRRAE